MVQTSNRFSLESEFKSQTSDGRLTRLSLLKHNLKVNNKDESRQLVTAGFFLLNLSSLFVFYNNKKHIRN